MDKPVAEDKVKKRDWVKNAAIIFLAALLVLTLFSSTIMNRSLPEVAAQYVRSGTLSVQIRGSGIVTAAESFEVKTSVSRTVLSVPVKAGDEVRVGDTLILFSEADSEELKAAQDMLDELNLNYQRALINSAAGKYSDQKRAVSDAQDALDAAKRRRDADAVSDAEIAAAENAVKSARDHVAACEAALLKAEAELAAYGNGGDSSSVNEAKSILDATKLKYAKELEDFQSTVNNRPDKTVSEDDYKAQLAQEYAAAPDKDSPTETGNKTTKAKQAEAYYAVKAAEDAYKAAVDGSSGGTDQYNKLKAAVLAAEANLAAANSALAEAEQARDELLQKKEAYNADNEEVIACQKALNAAVQNLEKSIALENLDFTQMKADIADQTALVESLKAGGEGAEVTSQVNGIVSVVNVSAGNMTSPDSTLMVVEVPDMGYTVSIPVTNEQSQRVRVGEAATVTTNYWNSNVTANLAAIKTNPENPATSKLLVFKISGDVQNNEQVGISIGEKGVNYDTIVPNSAVRTDSNGDFVLIVEAKSSAIGNQYKAVRIDVQVLSKDDSDSAVSGGLATSDFVITNSSAPLEPGMRVRLPD